MTASDHVVIRSGPTSELHDSDLRKKEGNKRPSKKSDGTVSPYVDRGHSWIVSQARGLRHTVADIHHTVHARNNPKGPEQVRNQGV